METRISIEAQDPYVSGDQEVDAFLALPPHERVLDGQPDLDTTITGILVGFASVLKRRGDHIDIITVSQATAEIKALIVRCAQPEER